MSTKGKTLPALTSEWRYMGALEPAEAQEMAELWEKIGKTDRFQLGPLQEDPMPGVTERQQAEGFIGYYKKVNPETGPTNG